MVLELYYRRVKRERRLKERKGPAMASGEKGEGRGKRTARDESKKGKSLRERGRAKQPLLYWAGLS